MSKKTKEADDLHCIALVKMLAVVLSSGLQACTTASSSIATPPTIASAATMACDADGATDGAEAVGDGAPAVSQTAESVSTMNSPGHNGLSARSLLFNAITQNPEALPVLMNKPLDTDLFEAGKHPYMSLQLTDRRARDVVADIVSCALDRSQHVTYVDPYAGEAYWWPGEMGLCPGWNTNKPSDDCLRVVSACLFARTNRLHRWVPASFGGPNLPPARDRIEVATKYSRSDASAGLSEGTEIPSFAQGWQPGLVGRCAPDQLVELALPRPPRCADASVRVCSGIHGCESDDPTFVTERTQGLCDDPSVSFACPADGFFGVMTKPDRVDVTVERTTAYAYPAAERDVFPFLEGAFFGSLFDPDGLARSREVVLDHGQPRLICKRLSSSGDDVDAVPNRRIFACYSLANDEQGVAYLNNRVCAKPGSRPCFPQLPRRCHFKDPDVNQREGYHCKWRSDDGLYRACVDDDGIAYPTITVFLHEPCGLSASGCTSPLPNEPTD